MIEKVILSGCDDARLCLWTSQQNGSNSSGKIKNKPNHQKVKQFSPYARNNK